MKNDNKGSAFVIVIVALALITTFIGFIYFQTNNQIKSNQNSLVNVDAKYASEAGIESTISKIIEQIEYKVNNYSKPVTKSTRLTEKSYNDNFGEVKNELLKAYDRLYSIVDEYNILNEELENLYEIISTNYISPDELKSNIENFKYSIIKPIAKEDDNIKNNIKDTIYLVLDDINSALIKLYSSNQIHNGEGHVPLSIETGSYGGDNVYVIAKDVDDKFIGTNDNAVHSYMLYSIRNFASKTLSSNVSNLKDGLSSVDIQNKVIILSNKVINLDNSLIAVDNKFWVIKNLQSSIQKYDNDLENAKKQVRDEIDNVLNYLIYDVEPYIYNLWIEQFKNYNELNDSNYIKIKNILTNIDAIKSNLIELKCKLGYLPIDIGGEVTPPKEPDTGLPPITSDDEIYIEIPEYSYLFSDGYGYYIDAINQTKIGLTYKDDAVQSVDDLSINIISTGSNRGKSYKIKSKVVFKTKNINGKFKTYYNIESYQKI